MDLSILAMIFPILFLSHSHSAQLKGYPLRFLAPTKVYELLTGFSSKVSTKAITDAIFYMLPILQLRPPLGVIIFQHQPFISLNSNQNTEPAMIQSLVQRKNNIVIIYSCLLYLTTKLPFFLQSNRPFSFAFEPYLLSWSNHLFFPSPLHA